MASSTRPFWFERGAVRAVCVAIVGGASACGGPTAEAPPATAAPASTAPAEGGPAPAVAAAPSSSASTTPAAAPSAAPTADRPPEVPAAVTAESAAAPAPTPCDVVLGVARQGQAKLNEVTVLTPHPDATRAEIMEATAVAVDALKVTDSALGKLAKGLAKALHVEAAAVKAFAVVYEAGKTPSHAVQKRVQDTAASDAAAAKAIVAYCRNASSSPGHSPP